MTYDMKNDQQGDEEWLKKRMGKVTASEVWRVVKRQKSGKVLAEYGKYMAEILGEKLTGQPKDFFKTRQMAFGTETEPQARAAYEFRTGNQVEVIDFIDHPTIPMAGASPDGLIGADGGLEIKCPETATMIDYTQTIVNEGAIDEKHMWQIQWNMACSGRAWWDYELFDPRIGDSDKQMVCVRVMRDPDMIADMEAKVIEFQRELADLEATFVATARAAA